MKIEIMDKSKKRKFAEEVSYLGVKKIPYLLLKTGKERVNAFSGSLSVDEIYKFWRLFPIEGFGLYFGKQIVDRRTGKKDSRLSMDSLHFLKDQIDKNIVKLNKKQEEEWFFGKNIDLEENQAGDSSGFVAVLSFNGRDFIGTGKLTDDKKTLISFLAKERRRRL